MSDQNSTALTIPERAAIALNSTKTEADLRALIELSADIEEVKDSAGRDQVHRMAMNLKNARIAVEKTGKAATEDAVAFHKGVVAEAKRLAEIVTPEEKRIFALRDGYDAQVEAEKQAKIAAERRRMERLESMVMDLGDFPHALLLEAESAAVPSVVFARGITELEACVPTEEVYEDYVLKAKEQITKSLATLREIHARAVAKEEAARAEQAAREAEAKRMEEQRAEMARQKAELDRIAAEQKAQADALQRQRDEEENRQRKEQEERNRVMAETKRQLEAQQAAIAAERKRAQDEIDAARAKLEADQKATEDARRLEQDHADALLMNQQVDAARYAIAWDEAHWMNTQFDADRLERDHKEALAMNADYSVVQENSITMLDGIVFSSSSDPVHELLGLSLDEIEEEPTDQEIIDCYIESFGGTPAQAVTRLRRFAMECVA